MKRWPIGAILLIFVSFAVAQTKALIGTSNSFVQSQFCKQYSCALVGRQQLMTNLEEWRYTHKYDGGESVVAVLRSKGVITSASFTATVQDVCCTDKRTIQLVQAMAGVTVTTAELSVLAEAAVSATGREVRISLLNKGSPAFISMLFSPEYSGANRFSFVVSQ